MIDHMIANCLGISKQLDQTMSMLATAVEEADKARLLALVEELRSKLRSMNNEMTQIRLGYENRNVTNERIENYRRSVRTAFAKNPQAVYWYEKTLTESFFEVIDEPAVRVAIINEVILQAASRFPNFRQPELWTTLITTKGLMNSKE